MKKVNVKYFLLLFVLVDACIDPLVIDVSNTKVLVVDGIITNQKGPYQVLLFIPVLSEMRFTSQRKHPIAL